MAFYLRIPDSDQFEELWEIDDSKAINLSISNAEHSGFGHFQAMPGEDIWSAIRSRTPWFEPEGTNPFHPIMLPPGQYYPRIARRLVRARPDMEIWNRTGELDHALVADAKTQARTLLRQLERICQTVQPAGANLDAFGHDIRNLLILASSEVEAQWRGVLRANGATKARLSTTDYVVLADVLKLRDYTVRFPSYPKMPSINPFEAWGLTGAPTQELAWYDAYNSAKHDRESAFEKATLHHAFAALSAVAVMLFAQFGRTGLGFRSDLSAFFQLVRKPAWDLGAAYASPRLTREGAQSEWVPTPHPSLQAIG